MEGSLNILRQAEAAGVKTFVYMSSVAALADMAKSIVQGDKLTDNGKLGTAV